MTVWLLFLNMLTHSSPCETIANDRILGEDLAQALPGFLHKMPGDAVIGYGFFTAGETPRAAIFTLAARWRALRFALRPRPAD